MTDKRENYVIAYDIATKKEDILYHDVLSFHLVETLFAAYKTLLEKEFKDSFKISTLVARFTKACLLITDNHPNFEQLDAMCKEIAKNDGAEDSPPLQKILKYIDDNDYQMAQACVSQFCHVNDDRLQNCKTFKDYFIVFAQTLNQLPPSKKRASNTNHFSNNRLSIFENANPPTSGSVNNNGESSQKRPLCVIQ